MAEENDEEKTIAEDLVVTKYKMAAELVNGILKKLTEACIVGAKVAELCELGDKMLATETEKVFKKEKDMKKGIAFPTCISVNNCICHFSPLKSDPEVEMKDGDLVKVDLGAHIDGFIAVAAHSLVVGASVDNVITGKKADVIKAAHLASEAALRLVRPGTENLEVTQAINLVAHSFQCIPIEGMLSHQLKQHVIDGEKSIIQNPSENQKSGKPLESWEDFGRGTLQSGGRKDHEKCEFETHEVFAIDVIISTGEGKGREMEARTTIYKKRDITYNLKMKASRQFLSEVEKKYATMPFCLRSVEDEKKARMGVVECVKHDLIEPFTVLWEREGALVAQFKFTVLLMPNGPMKITGLPFEEELYNSEFSIQDEGLKTLLASSASRKAAKKKKKKATAQATGATATAQVAAEP